MAKVDTRTYDMAGYMELANVSAVRAKAFMGFALNSARDEGHTNFRLWEGSHLHLDGEHPAANQVANYKAEFSNWIVANGLSELVEGLEMALEGFYGGLLIVESQAGRISRDSVPKRHRQFTRDGLEEKLNSICKFVGNRISGARHLVAIKQARNCYRHRKGNVGKDDLDESGCLHVTWIAPTLVMKTDDHDEKPLPLPLPEPVHVKADTPLGIRFVERRRSYKQGERLALSPADLAEMCFYFPLQAREQLRLIGHYMQRNNVPIVES
jgi:hypothetical protein